MSTIKVDTIATRTGSGNITLSNNVASLTSAGAISGTNITASGTLAVTGATTTGNITTGNTSIITAGRFISSQTSNDPWFKGVNSSNSETLFIKKDGQIYSAFGISLGGTGAANTLDDYEEGTWTPALSSGNSSTYDNAFGNYTKIGRFVACHFTLEIGNTFAGGTTQYLIAGLPFARSNQSNTASGSGIVHYFENIRTTAHALTLRVDSGLSIMYITGAVAANGATGLSVNSNVLQAQANLYGSVFYYTN